MQWGNLEGCIQSCLKEKVNSYPRVPKESQDWMDKNHSKKDSWYEFLATKWTHREHR